VKITVEQARDFFRHPSQQLGGIKPEYLPEEGFEYWAEGPVCGVFHKMPWPGVWGAHYGVDPAGWGRLLAPAKSVLRQFWDAHDCSRIIGWTPKSNRRAVAFARRLGFVVDGEMPAGDEIVVMQGWTP